MSKQSTESMAQFVDRFLWRTAIGVLLLSVAYALAAVMYLVSDGVEAVLDKVQLVMALAAVVVVLPAFVKFMRLRIKGRCRGSDSEGYVAEVFNKACVKAFSITFVFLIILEPVTKKYFTDLPTDFFINIVLCLTLGVFSLSFFSLIRDDDDDRDDEFDSEPEA